MRKLPCGCILPSECRHLLKLRLGLLLVWRGRNLHDLPSRLVPRQHWVNKLLGVRHRHVRCEQWQLELCILHPRHLPERSVDSDELRELCFGDIRIRRLGELQHMPYGHLRDRRLLGLHEL